MIKLSRIECLLWWHLKCSGLVSGLSSASALWEFTKSYISTQHVEISKIYFSWLGRQKLDRHYIKYITLHYITLQSGEYPQVGVDCRLVSSSPRPQLSVSSPSAGLAPTHCSHQCEHCGHFRQLSTSFLLFWDFCYFKEDWWSWSKMIIKGWIIPVMSYVVYTNSVNLQYPYISEKCAE